MGLMMKGYEVKEVGLERDIYICMCVCVYRRRGKKKKKKGVLRVGF